MNTEMTNAVIAANKKAQYDERAKRLLGNKNILTHILVKTVDEFKGMKPEDVAEYIEGEPYISVVPIEPGLTNIEKTNETGARCIGMNTENAEINEGMIRFDIVFYVRMKDGLSQIIVNIEAQKNEPSTYHILNRAIFYVSRLISSQKERDFENTNYDDIRRVFSIWICMNMPENSMDYYHLTNEKVLGSHPWEGKQDLLNIVLIGLSDKLPAHDKKFELHRLLCALLSQNMTQDEKLNIIEKEYDIPLEDNVRKDVSGMCNLGQGIEDAAIKKTMTEFILNMYRKGYTLEQIADVTERSIEEVKSVIEKNETIIA